MAKPNNGNDFDQAGEIEEDIFTLTDENGVEGQFELIGTTEVDGSMYYAMIPIDDTDGEYVILKVVEDANGEITLETIEDDDEFDKVSDVFDDLLFSEEDYDE